MKLAIWHGHLIIKAVYFSDKKRARFQKYDSKEPDGVKSTTVEIKISIKENQMENQTQKNTHGGARPGSGRKRKDTEARRATMAISGTKTELETIRQKAKASGKTTSRFLIEMALEKK